VSLHAGAESTEELGSRDEGCPVGAVECYLHPMERELGLPNQVLEVAVEGIGEPNGHPHIGPINPYPRRPVTQASLNGSLPLGGELRPVASEELDAVVGSRVVARTHHYPEVGPGSQGQMGHSPHRKNADVHGVDPGRMKSRVKR
jgi:hypothetical protein